MRERLPRMSKPCPTKKHRFRDHLEAVRALHHAGTTRKFAELDGRSSRRREQRAYKCTLCRGFHLTSQPERHVQSNAQQPVAA